jgi:hypothetical protein
MTAKTVLISLCAVSVVSVGVFADVPILTGTWDWETAFYEAAPDSPGAYGTGSGVLVITEQTEGVFTGYMKETGDWSTFYVNGAVMNDSIRIGGDDLSIAGTLDPNGIIRATYSNIPLGPHDDDYETGIFVARRRGTPRTRVARHVSVIEISKTVAYYRDPSPRYQLDVAVMVDDTVAAVSVVAPNGTTYSLQYEGDGEFWTPVLFATAQQMAAFPSGDWTFTVSYIDGEADITTVPYREPEGGDIPLVIQEPQMLFPENGEMGVSLEATFRWAAVTDEKATSIGLAWEPTDGPGISGQVELPATETRCGPITLSPGTEYELAISFSRVYRGENADGVHYVIDADAEQELSFRTRSW